MCTVIRTASSALAVFGILSIAIAVVSVQGTALAAEPLTSDCVCNFNGYPDCMGVDCGPGTICEFTYDCECDPFSGYCY